MEHSNKRSLETLGRKDKTMFTTLYRVKTTWLGADSASEYYFDTKAAAENNLRHLGNGEVDKVTIESDYPLNYSAGCTMDDLTYGYFDVTLTRA